MKLCHAHQVLAHQTKMELRWLLVLLFCLPKGVTGKVRNQPPEAAAEAALKSLQNKQAGANSPGEPASCQVGSCGHGVCESGQCVCQNGWAGDVCDLYIGGTGSSVEDCSDRAYCSDHGTCSDGICSCHAGWTGISCATQVVCPHHCNTPSGTCVNGACVCQYGFRGDACEELFCPTSCYGHGTCNMGTCACDAGWGGVDCGETDAVPDTTQQTTTMPPAMALLAAKRRAAARAAVAAKAAAAAAEGFKEAASRLFGSTSDIGQHAKARAAESPEVMTLPDTMNATMVSASASPSPSPSSGSMNQTETFYEPHLPEGWETDTTVVGLTPAAKTHDACHDNCSGHGLCEDGGCVCAEAWQGEACDMPACPNGCSGRGVCLNGACVCHQSFYGEECQYGRCLHDCSGNGYCDKGTCVCNAGFTGPGCAKKVVQLAPPSTEWLRPHAIGWGKVQASSICPENCNHNGHCSSEGVCLCLEGFTGVACQDFCPSDCSGNGVCTDGHCVCLSGYAGPDCAVEVCCSGHGDCSVPEHCECSAGWTGANCETQMVCPVANCSGHGQCINGACECEAGWTGPACTSPPAECGGPCPTGGFCDRETRTCLCGSEPCASAANLPPLPGTLGAPSLRGSSQKQSDGGFRFVAPGTSHVVSYKPGPPFCNEPHGHWDDISGSCLCQAPWFGKHCTQEHCPGFDEASGIPDCSAHGLCVAGACECVTGWGKAVGSLEGSNTCADPVCPEDCGDHGQCEKGQCVCQHGWQGQTCREPQCLHDCSGHGTCSFTLPNSPAECVCNEGYAFPDCAELSWAASLPKCPNDCSGNGLCMDGRCVCTALFTGDDCNTMVGSTAACPRDCSGYGLCFNGQCLCDETRTGPDCSLPVQCVEACQDVCLPTSTETEKCEFCKGQCETLMMRGVMGRHSPTDVRFTT
mmetsp:Transcript_43187/g.78543  ORF Transcript_43187/g.78543 Transcript_43187/m.78543 type:complete len:922 (-) Transcript_43187:19-2784(-)